MKVYTLCVGMGADAGDWPELGQWFHFTSMEAMEAWCKVTVFGEGTKDADRLAFGDWRSIDGDKPSAGEASGVGTLFNCLHWESDEDSEEEFWLADSVARVHQGEIIG